MSLSEIIQTALDKIQYIAKTETVVGEPITAGPVTLIPVSKISIGFAAGGAGKDEKSGSGAGTGGGVSITPIAFISITGDTVRVHPVGRPDIDLNRLFAMAPDLIKKVQKFMGRKADADDDKEEKK